MPWDWGTVGAVVVGGVVSGGATLGTAITRESIVARRDRRAEAALTQASARLLTMYFQQAWTLSTTLEHMDAWWHTVFLDEQRGIADAQDELRRIAIAASAVEWEAIANALYTLTRLCELRDHAFSEPGRRTSQPRRLDDGGRAGVREAVIHSLAAVLALRRLSGDPPVVVEEQA